MNLWLGFKSNNNYFAPSSMVIGKGLLARTFQQFKDDDGVLIFGSGVSNSQQTEQSEFDREKNLLSSYIKSGATLIYFSTVSVYDSSTNQSPYILHKKEMEQFISLNFSSYIIFRLPILVGKADNPFTLANFLFQRIINHEPVPVFKNACRYLMDADDVSLLLGKMIESKQFDNSTLDINFDNAIFIAELISIFENALGIKAEKTIVNKGSCYKTNNQKFIQFVESVAFKLSADYTVKTIRKYYSGKS